MRHIALLGLLAVAGCSWMSSSNTPAPAPASTTRAQMESGIDPSSHSVADITAVQKKLGVTADGVWGRVSEHAMRDYQQANGLEVTGTADRETRQQMGIGQPVVDPAPVPCHDNEVRGTDGNCGMPPARPNGDPYVHPDRPPTPLVQ